MGDIEQEEEFRRPRTSHKGKLHRGFVRNPNRTQSTIPAKSELAGTQTEHSRPQTHSSPEREGFAVRSRRFAPFPEHVDKHNTPGPGSYAAKAAEHAFQDTSVSKKGMGGFASQTQRFPPVAPAFSRGPAPGQYYDPKRSSLNVAPVNTRKIQLEPQLYHEPTPGPGFYEPRDPSYPSPNTQGSSAFLSSSQRVDFTPDTDKHTRKMGPGKYDPQYPAEKKPHVSSPFLSETKRVMNTTKSSTPGPGSYLASDVDEDLKSLDQPKRQSQGRLLSKSLVHSNSSMFSRQVQQKNLSPSPPGPGEYYDPKLHSDLNVDKKSYPPSPVAPPRIRRHSMQNSLGSSFASQTQRNLTLTSSTSSREHLGPGAYKTETTIGKQSFNANRKDNWV